MSKARKTNTTNTNETKMNRYAKKVHKHRGKKCVECNRKLKLSETIGNRCKCEKIFCNHHKPSTMHNCSFDYKDLCKKQLSESIQKVVPQKLSLI